MAKLISKTYGDALFDVAMESERLDDFLNEAQMVLNLFLDNKDLVKLMNHPKVPKEEKVTLLENCFSQGISAELLGIMRIMVMKDRTSNMEEVLEYFIDRVKEHKNIGRATVTAAMELTGQQKEKIKKKLLETTNYVEFEITYKVDPSLIGGMVIRIKDRVVDSSIKTKLSTLSRELSKIQLKAGECAP